MCSIFDLLDVSRELSVDNVYLTKSFYWLSTYDLIIERMNQVKQ